MFSMKNVSEMNFLSVEPGHVFLHFVRTKPIVAIRTEDEMDPHTTGALIIDHEGPRLQRYDADFSCLSFCRPAVARVGKFATGWTYGSYEPIGSLAIQSERICLIGAGSSRWGVPVELVSGRMIRSAPGRMNWLTDSYQLGVEDDRGDFHEIHLRLPGSQIAR